jgi:hypothetical protein
VYFGDTNVKTMGYFNNLNDVRLKIEEIIGEDINIHFDCRKGINNLKLENYGVYMWVNENINHQDSKRLYISKFERNSEIP